jgi:transcriptional regulator with XRE-family HTH domain
VTHLAQRMRVFWRRSGRTQAEIAVEIGVTPGAVSRWLGDGEGAGRLHIEHLERFARAVGVDVSSLFPRKRVRG